jgi:hypothetical protein
MAGFDMASAERFLEFAAMVDVRWHERLLAEHSKAMAKGWMFMWAETGPGDGRCGVWVRFVYMSARGHESFVCKGMG